MYGWSPKHSNAFTLLSNHWVPIDPECSGSWISTMPLGGKRCSPKYQSEEKWTSTGKTKMVWGFPIQKH